MQFHIPGRLGQDIDRGGLQTTSHVRDHIHDGHGVVIKDGADSQEGQGGQDQGVVDEETAKVSVADDKADAGEEASDGQAGPNGRLPRGQSIHLFQSFRFGLDSAPVTDHKRSFSHHGRFLLDGQRSDRHRSGGHLVSVYSQDVSWDE